MMAEITKMPDMEQDKFRAAIELLKRNVENHIEYHKTLAKIRKASFDAYIAQGFTAEQALELCAKN